MPQSRADGDGTTGATAGGWSPPWTVAGRAISIWFRLEDPEQAQRHVSQHFEMDLDPVVGVRFWELVHDAGRGVERVAEGRGATRFHEATVAFPVRYRQDGGDNTAIMLADEPTWICFSRESMGWPVLPGTIAISPSWPGAQPQAGMRVRAAACHQGARVLSCEITLSSQLPSEAVATRRPTWLNERIVPSVLPGPPDVHQIVRSGPDTVRWGPVWSANASLSVDGVWEGGLAHLRPREIVAAEYWSEIELAIPHGTVIHDLRHPQR